MADKPADKKEDKGGKPEYRKGAKGSPKPNFRPFGRKGR